MTGTSNSGDGQKWKGIRTIERECDDSDSPFPRNILGKLVVRGYSRLNRRPPQEDRGERSLRIWTDGAHHCARGKSRKLCLCRTGAGWNG